MRLLAYTHYHFWLGTRSISSSLSFSHLNLPNTNYHVEEKSSSNSTSCLSSKLVVEFSDKIRACVSFYKITSRIYVLDIFDKYQLSSIQKPHQQRNVIVFSFTSVELDLRILLPLCSWHLLFPLVG